MAFLQIMDCLPNWMNCRDFDGCRAGRNWNTVAPVAELHLEYAFGMTGLNVSCCDKKLSRAGSGEGTGHRVKAAIKRP
jgi:hypothetical protein